MKLLKWMHRQLILCCTHAATISSVGLKARFHINSKPEYKVIVGGLAESRLRDAVFAELRSDDVMVEVGAHVGSWSVFLAMFLSQGQLHAFEPVPHNYEKLSANLKLNGIKNATAYQKALGEAPGTAEFTLEDNDAPVQGSLIPGQSGASHFTVQVDTLDALSQTLKRKPTALKIDCEGAEAMVIRGGSQTIRDSVRVIFLELHRGPLQQMGESSEQVIQSIVDVGFKIQKQWPETQHALFVRSNDWRSASS